MSEELKFEPLITGPANSVGAVPLDANQVVVKGDLLECSVTTKAICAAAGTEITASSAIATTFHKATAAAKPGNVYVIAAEDVTTSGSAGTVCAYGAGFYNIDKVGITGDAATNKLVLLAQGIVLEKVKSGEDA